MSHSAASAPTWQSSATRNIGYELFIGALSLLSVVNIFLLLFIRDPAIEAVISIINSIASTVFLIDFLYRLLRTHHKRHYFTREWGWADLLSSLPFPFVMIFRIFRVVRVTHVLRHYGLKGLANAFSRSRAQNALLTVAFLVILLLEFGSLAVLFLEQNAVGANITTAGDAIWWVYVTVTTVGYGDHYPVTSEGRVVAIIVMTAGVALFGTISGFLANKLLTPLHENEEAETRGTLQTHTAANANTPVLAGSAPAMATSLAPDLPAYVESGNLNERVASLRAILETQQGFVDRVRAELDAIDTILAPEHPNRDQPELAPIGTLPAQPTS